LQGVELALVDLQGVSVAESVVALLAGVSSGRGDRKNRAVIRRALVHLNDIGDAAWR
jgi:hypothetical protein